MTQILGQTRALDILDKALRSSRFHHAWIFSGPRGVGKFTTAVEVARILLEPDFAKGTGGRGLGTERSLSARSTQSAVLSTQSFTQQLIDAGTHPDLHIIRKELALYSDERKLRESKQSNIPINLLRERVIGGKSGDTYYDAPAYRTAARGHGKVFIFDEAELLDSTGQNAMLKTLEEPPAETYFFLITTQPEELLPTIRSRCQHVRFGALDEKSMRACLNDKPDDWVLQFAEGSPGVAALAAEFGFHNWQKTLDPMIADLERGKFPVAMGETLGALIEEFAQAWVAKHGKKTTSKDAANKDGARHMLTLLASHARCKLKQRIDQGKDASDWAAVIDLLHDAEVQLDSNVNQKLLMENLVVQWSQAMSGAHAVA